eukprot:TRINITY_DN33546_c0_g1_i1.p1 TRINITY_DN33546_c0_g1~~TRINITY_DN33546_c0_g1_i1.p1  ORF type:complete len:394 (-),score=45.21 TRINITY_DN33546_c0_g1_i1:7-1038(-)
MWNHVGGYWASIWPFFYLGLVQFYAYYIVPLVYAVLYGKLMLCASWKSVRRGLLLCEGKGLPDQDLEDLHSQVWGSESRSCEDSEVDSGSEQSDDNKAQARAWIERNCRCCLSTLSLIGLFEWISPTRELKVSEEDRRTLIRLDWSRLGKDFLFTKATMLGLEPYKFTLKQIDDATMSEAEISARDVTRGEIPDDSLKTHVVNTDLQEEAAVVGAPECKSPYDRGLLDVLVGQDNLYDGDVNVEFDDSLRDDLYPEPDNEFFLNDTLIQIVFLTMVSISFVAMEQTTAIFLIRALYTDSLKGFVHAMKVTIEERSTSAWVAHVQQVGYENWGALRNFLKILGF